MNDDLEAFNKVYRLYLRHGGSPTPFFETHCAVTTVTEDDRRNEGALYRIAFRERGREVFQSIVRPLVDRIRIRAFDPTMAEYVDLACAQAIGAKARFQYRVELMPQFEEFIRIFDQVDIDVEKKTLWTWSKRVDASKS